MSRKKDFLKNITNGLLKKWKIIIIVLLAINEFLFFVSCGKNKNFTLQEIDSLITSSNYSKAEEILKKYLDKNPDSPLAIFQLANVYAAQSFHNSDSLDVFSDSLKALIRF